MPLSRLLLVPIVNGFSCFAYNFFENARLNVAGLQLFIAAVFFVV